MKKRKLIIIIAIIAIILIAILTFFLTKKTDDDKTIVNSIKITQYEQSGAMKELKHVNASSDEDIEKISRCMEELTPLPAEEAVNIMLLREVTVVYNNTCINMQLEQKDYCSYYNTENGLIYTSKMPEGLYEWVEEKLK